MSIVGEVRRAAAVVAPDIPLVDPGTFEQYVETEIAPTRFTMTLASAFALLALVMAAVGLYAVISYSVTQRWSELGVRVALGADNGDIVRLVLRHGATMAGGGILLGLGASLGVTRAIRSLLVGIPPYDLVTFAGVSILLAAVTALASYLPARRATRLDPVAVLRKQ